jgi:two-component system sensor histidine kinase CreC
MAPARYFAIEGLIGVGKTSLCRLIERRWGARLVLEPWDHNPFLAAFYEDRARFAANVLGEAERLRRIVDRLLELAALEARRAGPAWEPLDLAKVVDRVVAEARGAAELRGVALRTALPAALPGRGDAFLLGQALGNLVQNALEFSPRGGEVTVSARTEGGAVVVEVDDGGPGVPDYALARVFERFYSLPRPDSGRKSSGLGLSIVREIARLHRGEAALANRAGGGARATLTLPAAGA